MSVYLTKGKGYRYDFKLSGARYTGAWFATKKDAKTGRGRKEGSDSKPEGRVDGGDPNRHDLLGHGEPKA